MRFIHTADWQIGKVFGALDDSTMHALQDARLDAITTIGRLAREHKAEAVLVAGDVYESHGIKNEVRDRAIERMRAFPGVAWHLIPGNHDFDRPNGLWDRMARQGLPEHVYVHRQLEPVAIAGGRAWLLPAPLQRRHSLNDATAYMDAAATPEGALRIGLAHGSIRQFGSTPGSTANRIAADRTARAGLDFLALGDWHGTLEIGPRCWYAGTPEADGFDQPRSGAALLVDLPGPGSLPSVTSLATGRYHWHREQVVIHGIADIDLLDERLRGRQPDPASLRYLLVRLELDGTLSLADRLHFDERIGQGLRAALRFLDLRDRVLIAPSRDDLDAMAPSGVVRAAAERLGTMIDRTTGEQREIAEMALLRLCVEHRRAAP